MMAMVFSREANQSRAAVKGISATGTPGGRETEFFVEGEWGLLPLFQRNDGGEGWGEEAVFAQLTVGI
jgi:hypothetical protein